MVFIETNTMFNFSYIGYVFMDLDNEGATLDMYRTKYAINFAHTILFLTSLL